MAWIHCMEHREDKNQISTMIYAQMTVAAHPRFQY